MKAIVHTQYGSPDVLHLEEVPKPVPKDNEVLIKVYATTVTSAECGMRKGQPLWGRIILGLTKPRKKLRTLGLELAGEIEAVGKNVTRFRVGDQVFGFTGFGVGACAEYKCMPETGSLALKPVNKSYEEAVAVVDGASTALYFLRDKANILPGQKVLINGASGSIGTYAVQLAKYFEAEVTGVCGTRNVELVKSLGADHVIDYSQADFTKNRETYDVIFDTVGKSSFSRCKMVLKRDGCYISTTGLINYFLVLWTSIIGTKKVKSGMSVEKNKALIFLKEMVEADKLKIIIDRCYPLEQTAEAHRHVETGHKKGNVVITVEQDAIQK
jgi:NADPH:quinone reductase-like Zn-dependent oxidoreductase